MLAVAVTACAGVHSAKQSTLAIGDGSETLCLGRERCMVNRRRAAGDARLVVDVRIGHRPNAADDADRCDRREYWLVAALSHRLIAVDCEAQWGADNPGPADTSVTGDKMALRYTEFGASDTCQIYDAIVDLASFRIESEGRADGESKNSSCINRHPSGDLVAPGDGSPSRPLVTLHP